MFIGVMCNAMSAATVNTLGSWANRKRLYLDLYFLTSLSFFGTLAVRAGCVERTISSASKFSLHRDRFIASVSQTTSNWPTSRHSSVAGERSGSGGGSRRDDRSPLPPRRRLERVASLQGRGGGCAVRWSHKWSHPRSG